MYSLHYYIVGDISIFYIKRLIINTLSFREDLNKNQILYYFLTLNKSYPICLKSSCLCMHMSFLRTFYRKTISFIKRIKNQNDMKIQCLQRDENVYIL